MLLVDAGATASFPFCFVSLLYGVSRKTKSKGQHKVPGLLSPVKKTQDQAIKPDAAAKIVISHNKNEAT